MCYFYFLKKWLLVSWVFYDRTYLTEYKIFTGLNQHKMPAKPECSQLSSVRQNNGI